MPIQGKCCVSQHECLLSSGSCSPGTAARESSSGTVVLTDNLPSPYGQTARRPLSYASETSDHFGLSLKIKIHEKEDLNEEARRVDYIYALKWTCT